jgi:outer membrane protein TolC
MMKIQFGGSLFAWRVWSLSLILIGLLAKPLTAQTITLRRAVELALNHGREGGVSEAGQDRARAAYQEARAAYFPRLVFGSGIGGSYGFPLSLENAAPSLFNVTSQQVLYSPAQKAFVRSANTSWVAAKWQGRDERDALIQDTVLTYVELNKWSQEIELLETELANNQKMEGIEQQRIQAGVDSPVEMNRVRLATARVRMRIAEAKGSADVMRIHLAQLTGLSAAELSTDSNSIPSLPDIKQDDDLAAKAVEASPAVKAAEQQALAKRYTAEAESKALLPSVDVAGQYALLSNFNNYDVYLRNFQRHNATGGLVFRLPFFDRAQRSRAAQAKADAILGGRDAELAKEKVSLETLRLQRMVQELAAAVDVAQLEYDLAQSDLQVIEERLKAETGTLREQQEARNKVEQTYDALIDANFALDKARVQLLRNTGELEQWALAGK